MENQSLTLETEAYVNDIPIDESAIMNAPIILENSIEESNAQSEYENIEVVEDISNIDFEALGLNSCNSQMLTTLKPMDNFNNCNRLTPLEAECSDDIAVLPETNNLSELQPATSIAEVQVNNENDKTLINQRMLIHSIIKI